MNEKNKKRLLFFIIGILSIIIIYLLMVHPTGVNISSGGTCSTPSIPTNSVTGVCDRGGSYICTTTCTNRPAPTVTENLPTDGYTCRTYSTKEGYSASAWQLDINSLSSCENLVNTNYCSSPSKIQIKNNCCMWSC